MRKMLFAMGLAGTLGVTVQAQAKTHKVSTDEQLYIASRSVNPGDVVEIEGGRSYKGRLFFERSGAADKPITLRGIRKNGKRPIIAGGDETLTINANHYIVESIEITGGEVRCVFVYGHDITLRDLNVHDCKGHGILSADDDSGTLLIDRCELYKNGNGGRLHQIYVTSDQFKHPGSVFRIQYSYIHDANGGNNIKSRAERNEIYFNWIEGARYHELELIGPDVDKPPAIREDSDIVGNVLRNTNPEAHGMRLGGDATMDTNGRYRLAFNTIIMASNERSPVRLFDGIESLELYNNAFIGPRPGGLPLVRTDRVKWTRGKPLIIGSHNFIPKGSSQVPSELKHSIFGDDAGFVNAKAFDLRPTAKSPLLNAASTSMPTHPDAPFPRALEKVTFHPPARTIAAPRARPLQAGLDIGALEGGGPAPTASATVTLPAPPSSSKPAPDSPRTGSGGAVGGTRSRCQCEVVGARGDASGGGWGAVVALVMGLGWRRRRRT